MIRAVRVGVHPPARFEDLVHRDRLREALRAANETRDRLSKRVVWNVNSTAPRSTTRHGRSASRCCARTRTSSRRSCVQAMILHDPQTAGVGPALAAARARLVWRCHLGIDGPNAESVAGWEFLHPCLDRVSCSAFSRETDIPAFCDRGPDVRSVVDDLEGAVVFHGVEKAWQAFPDEIRSRVHLVSLPTEDIQELGRAARKRVREHFLGVEHLLRYAELLARVDAAAS